MWPGKGDVDQLYLMRKTLGDLLPRHMSIYDSNAFFKGIQLEAPDYYVRFHNNVLMSTILVSYTLH